MGGMIIPDMLQRRDTAKLHLRATTAPLPDGSMVFADVATRGDAAAGAAPGERARAIYEARRRRDTMLGNAGPLFHDPAWDIMLDLFVRGEQQEVVSVSSACVASCAPHSTALRCLKAMERKGLVAFERDPFDKRRRFVALNRDMRDRMADWLAEC
ncbi:MarR family transcriptional regulator [Sphingomonas sp. RT2P30]|uniref:MarR family transcriptional regulator n=1 Tax=Parasphingomonas halimpatiens TaxID=3096162 RepID=UPI002FC6D324